MMNASNAPAPSAHIIRIPRGIRSKQKLFAILADKLHFPRYFGWNWDALEELLRDLSWLSAVSIVIIHDDLPFGAAGENRVIYLQLIQAVTAHWQATDPERLRFMLPAD
jgi:hypothetical protein